MKRRIFITIIYMLVIVISTCSVWAENNDQEQENNTNKLNHSDIKGHWAEKAMERMVANDVLAGDDNGYLHPDRYITRAELGTIITRCFGSSGGSLAGFKDVDMNEWYVSSLAAAVSMGIIKGDGANLYPNGLVTREEALTIIGRAFLISHGDKGSLKGFRDSFRISKWAVPYVSAMIEKKYISGYNGNINPGLYITRAELSAILNKIIGAFSDTEKTSGKISGNLLVRHKGADLGNMFVEGDMIIAEGVQNEAINLYGAKCTGKLVLRGINVNSIKGIDNFDCSKIAFSEKNTFSENLPAKINKIEIFGNNLKIKTKLKLTELKIMGQNTSVEADGEIMTVYLIGTNSTITGKGKVGKVIVTGKGAQSKINSQKIEDKRDKGLVNAKINIDGIPHKLGIYEDLKGSVTISGIEGVKICKAQWLYNGKPIPGFSNEGFKAYNGAKTSIHVSLPRYYGMELNPKITFRLYYDGEMKEASRNVKVGYIPYAYYDAANINAVMNRVTKVEVEAWSKKNIPLLSSPKGRIIRYLPLNTYMQIILTNQIWAKVRTSTGNIGYVKVGDIRISSKNYTLPGDFYIYDKNTWINKKNFSSATPYLVWINIKHQKVNLFYGERGNFNCIRVMPCATGKNTTPTNNGIHKYYKMDSRWNFDNVYYVAPALRFNRTGEAMHSRPKRMNGTLLEAYMGVPVSHGCVRMMDEDIYWLAKNLPLNSTVIVW